MIKYYIKSVYGVDRNYPANDQAKAITNLTGRATLSQNDLAIAAQQLGLKVEIVLQQDSEL